MPLSAARARILHFLQLSHCAYSQHGNQIQTETALLILDETALVIARPGKPQRVMPYQKLNLDRLLFLINPTTAASAPQ